MNTTSKERPVKRFLVPAVCAVTLMIPVIVWLVATHGPVPYFTHQVPPGQRFYILSKLCALLGLTLLWLQSMTALARFSPALRGFFSLPRLQHVLLGATTLILVGAHVGLFIAASTLRTGHLALPLLLPKFDQGFYASGISIGAIAVWLLLLVAIAGMMRARGHQWARWIHRISFAVFGLGFLHGIFIGSETRFGLMKYVYAFIGLSLATALLSWILAEVRRGSRVRAHASGAAIATSTANGE